MSNQKATCSKRERFVRVATKRMDNVLHDLYMLGRCADTACYEWTKEDTEKICSALDEQVGVLRDKFSGYHRFRLSKGPAKTPDGPAKPRSKFVNVQDLCEIVFDITTVACSELRRIMDDESYDLSGLDSRDLFHMVYEWASDFTFEGEDPTEYLSAVEEYAYVKLLDFFKTYAVNPTTNSVWEENGIPYVGN